MLKILIFCLYCCSLCALESDKNQMIHFSAGAIEWNELNYHSVFSHDVHFAQGSTKISASHGYSDGDAKNRFTKIVLFGRDDQQAAFSTLNKENEPELHAKADKMIYLPIQKLIKLIGHVQVEQGKYHFTAPYLEYHTDSKKVLTKARSEQITSIIIDPEPS